MRVFLDANILFSAAKSDGAVRSLLRLLVLRGHECWVDAYLVAEARRNLEAKDAATVQRLDALIAGLRVASAGAPAQRAMSNEATDWQWLPPEDRPVLAAAIALACDALVTGDRAHFGAGYGRAFGGATIHSPRTLAERVLSREWN